MTYEEIQEIAEWNEVTLKSYIGKNKIAPFLQPIEGSKFKILLDGSGISENYFHETFTQTSPRHLPLSAGDRFKGETAEYELVDHLGNGAVGHVWSAKVIGDTSDLGALPSPQRIGASAFALPELRAGVGQMIRQMVRFETTERPSLSDVQNLLAKEY